MLYNSSDWSAVSKPEQFPISCVCKSLHSYKKCSTSEKISHLGCVNFDLTRATDKEEYHWFLHVSKRKDSDVSTKVSSAIVLVAGWLENDKIKLSCYPMMDPDGIMLFGGVDTPKHKVGGSTAPLIAQNLASFNQNGASVVQMQDKCNLWLSSSADANSPMQDPKKLCRSSRASNFRYSSVKRSVKRLSRPKRISRQRSTKFDSKCKEIPDINLSDTCPNASEIKFDTNLNRTEPLILNNTVQLPLELSADEFLDFDDTEDEFDMQSCIEESDEPLFSDLPAREEKYCDLHDSDLQSIDESMSRILNSSGIAVIDQLLTEVVPSCSAAKNECQSIQSKKSNPHESDLRERCQIEAPKMSDSQQNHQPASIDMKKTTTFSTENSNKILNSNAKISNATSEESQTSSMDQSSIKENVGRPTPYLLKKCEPILDLSIKVCGSNSTGTSGSACEKRLNSGTREHPSVEITTNGLLNEDLSNSKKCDDPVINTFKPATNISGSRSGMAQSSGKHSAALRRSMVTPFGVVGRNKSSSGTSIPAIPSKEHDDLSSKVNKSSIVELCSGKVSRGQKYQSRAMRFGDVRLSETSTESHPQITTSISDSRCKEANKGKQSNFKLISSDVLQSLQGPFTIETNAAKNTNLSNALKSYNSKEHPTTSARNSVSSVIEKCSGATENHNTMENMDFPNSSGESSKQNSDDVVVQTGSSLVIQKMCDLNIASVSTGNSKQKVQLRTVDHLGPSDALVWSSRVRKVCRKLRIVRLLAKPNNT